MRRSLVQCNSQEKHRGKLGEGELSAFNVDSVKYFCQKLLIIPRSAELFWPYLVPFERCFAKLTFDTWNLKKRQHIVSESDLKDVKFFRLILFKLFVSSKTQWVQFVWNPIFQIKRIRSPCTSRKRISQICNTLGHFLYLFTAHILHTQKSILWDPGNI